MITQRPRPPAKFDLVLKGGLVVTENIQEIADVATMEGRVAQIGGAPSGRQEIDASGHVVTPGGIDMHVHFTPMPTADLPRRPDDFESGSLAAANGGITTVGNMTHQVPGEGLLAALERDKKVAENTSIVDFVLHPVLNEPSALAIEEIARLGASGYGTMKVFIVFPNFGPRLSEYRRAMTKAAEHNILVLVHCEDPHIISRSMDALVQAGNLGAEHYGDSRPIQAEVSAVELAVDLAEGLGGPIHIVHLSSERALDVCRKARRRGAQVHVETRPLYLHFTDDVFERIDAALYIGNPPPRKRSDRAAMWDGLSAGDIDVLASDHAPWNRAQKLAAGLDIRNALPGVPELDTMLPLLFSEGVIAGRLTLAQFVDVTATNPARLLGIEAKGQIKVGSDADLTVWDPNKKWRVGPETLATNADHSPYESWEVQGAPVYTIVRGRVVRSP
ncbi:MAG: amidohydrolase family protein, partial [Acidimicrobiia bacterium]|nr:amidohydrolase family protein [Acidimicrobiia bacterium]